MPNHHLCWVCSFSCAFHKYFFTGTVVDNFWFVGRSYIGNPLTKFKTRGWGFVKKIKSFCLFLFGSSQHLSLLVQNVFYK